jgi:quinol monooxygenase YgiN
MNEPLYIFARFEPLPGKESELRAELEAVLEPTRAEPGCVRVNQYESVRGPLCFFVHSQWIDEAAFEAHAKLPHTQRLIERTADLMAQPLLAVRTHEIG